MRKQDLTMSHPIWVWCYDYGAITHPQAWEGAEVQKQAYPQAHTYAFRNEADAMAHPALMGWGKDHPYVLQRCFLNGDAA